MPLIEGKAMGRIESIGFLYSNRKSYSNEKYKIVSYGNKPFELYDMQNDVAEKKNMLLG